MQRVVDIILSLFALTFLAPLFFLIALLLRFTGEGEVFYSQERVGRNGELFNIYKFATMLRNSPSLGTGMITVKNDPRILPLGRFLRLTKINELPQLFNVFRGDMSLVGPRPQTQRCFNSFPKPLQNEIAKVTPGLSGVGSIVFRGEEQFLDTTMDSIKFYDEVVSPYKAEIECWYVKNRNLKVYFSVIFLTVWVVVFPSSKSAWRVFKGLPAPPDPLKDFLNYE